MHAAERMSRHRPPSEVRNSTPDDKAETTETLRGSHEQNPFCGPETNVSSDLNISQDQIQAALARALESAEFQTAPQLRSFLDFVVQAALNHRPEKLKGYLIAVEALGRSKDFNPVLDPIVRVEAARLRRRLARYYKGSGNSEPVRISIPKGSYAPEFALAAHSASGEQSAVSLRNTQSRVYQIRTCPGPGEPGAPAHNFSVKQEAGGNLHGSVRFPRSIRPGGFLSSLTATTRSLLRYPVPFFAVVVLAVVCFVAGFFTASA